MWTLRQYVSARGESAVSAWFERLPEEAQASVLVSLEYLVGIERDGWRRPKFDVLTDLAGMGEIILGKVDAVQTRLVGFFGPKRHEFTIVLVVTKKGRNYSPPRWQGVAFRRCQECRADKERSDAWYP